MGGDGKGADGAMGRGAGGAMGRGADGAGEGAGGGAGGGSREAGEATLAAFASSSEVGKLTNIDKFENDAVIPDVSRLAGGTAAKAFPAQARVFFGSSVCGPEILGGAAPDPAGGAPDPAGGAPDPAFEPDMMRRRHACTNQAQEGRALVGVGGVQGHGLSRGEGRIEHAVVNFVSVPIVEM